MCPLGPRIGAPPRWRGGRRSNQALKLSATDFQSVLGKYVIPGAEESGGDVSSGEWGGNISPDDSLVFISVQDRATDASSLYRFDVFDSFSGTYLRQTAQDPYIPYHTVFDHVGRYLFVAGRTSEEVPQLRVHATGADVAPLHPPKPQSLLNVSTRLKSQPGDNVLIGGFIISGTESKQIAVRGMGPSIPVTGKLGDPILNVYDKTGKLISTNDNWNSDRASVLASGLAPIYEREAVSILTLAPGNYTVTVGGALGKHCLVAIRL